MRFFALATVAFTAAVSVFASPLERQTPSTFLCIMADLTNTVTPLANSLLYATPQNATADILTPIIGDINAAMVSAATSLNQLGGQPVTAILASVDGTSTLAASDVAGLLADVLNLVFGSVNAALLVADTTISSVITDVLPSLVTVVFGLISATLPLVTGLLGPLLSLLAPILSTISNLGLTSLLGELLGGLL